MPSQPDPDVLPAFTPLGARCSRKTARSLTLIVLAGATAGCGDVLAPGSESLTTAELFMLPLQSDAPAPEQRSTDVVNSRTTVHLIVHPDRFNTRYLEIRFPAGCVDGLSGVPVGDADSVLITIRPRAGLYDFSLNPADLALAATCGAAATLFFARYGDLSVADGSSTYLDRAAYAAALGLWQETRPGVRRIASGSSATGSDAVGCDLDEAGSFVVAAPR